MFEAVELGREMSKAEYEKQLPVLRARLIEAHEAARQAGMPILIIISGMDGAGKGTVVHRLNEWLDPRGIDTHSFWSPSDEERERPHYWRFWRTLPARGRIAIHFGGWYDDVLAGRVRGKLDEVTTESALARIAALEQMLVQEGTLVLKFWFHLTRKAQRRRLEESAASGLRRRVVLSLERKHLKDYARFAAAAETMIRRTDTGFAPWCLVEAADGRHRDFTTGQMLLKALRSWLEPQRQPPPGPRPTLRERRPAVTVLDRVDLTQAVASKRYEQELEQLQAKLNRLTWKASEKGVSSILVFEGWDAAGKGSAIRRVTEAIDARLFRVVPVASPTEEERAHHYLWRFWRHLPRSGLVTIFDRSWYGRVLVERVEGFASREAWGRAYHEINEFEKQLTEAGTVVLKFWLHISKDEQLRRFRRREEVPHKRYKITEEDWRNRKQWGAYKLAVHDMVTHTSTEAAPWMLVPGNDKKLARLEILRCFCKALKRAL